MILLINSQASLSLLFVLCSGVNHEHYSLLSLITMFMNNLLCLNDDNILYTPKSKKKNILILNSFKCPMIYTFPLFYLVP